MEYKDFINKLYIKGAGITKVNLTRQLFLSAVNNTSSITDKRNSDSAYKRYNSGSPINAIAYDAVNDLNQSKIEVCIEEYLYNMQDKKSENVQKICGRCKADIPDLTPENISVRIASFFVDEVLKPAAEEYKKRIGNNVSSEIELPTIPNVSSGNNKTDVMFKEEASSKESLMEKWYSQLQPPSPPFSESTLNRIEEIVKKSYIILRTIDDLDLIKYIDNMFSFHRSHCCLSVDQIIRQNRNCIPDEIYQKLIEYYNKLHGLLIELEYYSEMHIYCPLSDAAAFSVSLTFDNFLSGILCYHEDLKEALSLLSFAIQKLRR